MPYIFAIPSIVLAITIGFGVLAIMFAFIPFTAFRRRWFMTDALDPEDEYKAEKLTSKASLCVALAQLRLGPNATDEKVEERALLFMDMPLPLLQGLLVKETLTSGFDRENRL